MLEKILFLRGHFDFRLFATWKMERLHLMDALRIVWSSITSGSSTRINTAVTRSFQKEMIKLIIRRVVQKKTIWREWNCHFSNIVWFIWRLVGEAMSCTPDSELVLAFAARISVCLPQRPNMVMMNIARCFS